MTASHYTHDFMSKLETIWTIPSIVAAASHGHLNKTNLMVDPLPGSVFDLVSARSFFGCTEDETLVGFCSPVCPYSVFAIKHSWFNTSIKIPTQ